MVLHRNLIDPHLHAPMDHTHLEADITDLTAIHTDVADEINQIAGLPLINLEDTDLFMVEVAGSGYEKAKVQWNTIKSELETELGAFLPLSGGTMDGAIYFDVTGTPAIGVFTAPSTIDQLLYFDTQEISVAVDLHLANQAALTSITFPGSVKVNLAALNASNEAEIGDINVLMRLMGAATRPTYDDGGTLSALAFYTDLDNYLPLTAGSGDPLTGSLFIDAASSPTLHLREGGTTTYDSEIVDYGAGLLQIIKRAAVGGASIWLDPDPGSAAAAEVGCFRETNTASSLRQFIIYQGDGTATVAFEFNAATKRAYIDTLRGTVGVDEIDLEGVRFRGGWEYLNNDYALRGNLLGDLASVDLIYCNSSDQVVVSADTQQTVIRGLSVQLPYLAAAPITLANGMMWMESDGLHIYYAGAEKIVAGV